MKKIIIIGSGFGGLSAANSISRRLGSGLDIILIDKKQTFDFLPTLPDTIGRGIKPQHLSYRIEDGAKKLGIRFINKEVVSLDLEQKKILTSSEALGYDYLVIASGSEANFYGNENIKKSAYTLDSVEDAKRIACALEQEEFENFIIGGGGYTGIEVATNLRLFLEKKKRDGRIIIVERAQSILGPLPARMKGYVSDNLKRLRIDVFVNSAIDRIEARKVYISEGRVFDNAFVIWAAGVKTAKFIQDLKVEKNPQGRIKVDDYLRLNDNCFAIGDVAYFSYKNIFLRMAVQFSIAQGECVANNIINIIGARKPKKYRPRDFGYIIPMANNKSCGIVLGVNLKGFLPTMLHLLMCIYRSYGLKNKLGLIEDMVKIC